MAACVLRASLRLGMRDSRPIANVSGLRFGLRSSRQRLSHVTGATRTRSELEWRLSSLKTKVSLSVIGWLADNSRRCYGLSVTDLYEPASDFLKAVIAQEVPPSGSAFADANMSRLIAMTRDSDLSNRDWATMLLAAEEADTPEIRDALLSAANDESVIVRAEALVGIARRAPDVALPLVSEALSMEEAGMPLFEALP